VVDVDRPNRQRRRRLGKSDPADAIAAARAALGGEASATAKVRTGSVESIRVLRVARRSAKHQRITALNQMRALVSTAPDALRASLHGLTVVKLIDKTKNLRPAADLTDPLNATKFALRQLARRIDSLDDELHRLDEQLETLVRGLAPELVDSKGIGIDSAGALLVAAGENTDRLHNEASFAHLCASAPIEASSGMRVRHRLNRGGNRDANQALWRIVLVRLSFDAETRAYLERRVSEGKTKKEAIRCLKRYVAREVFALLPRAQLALDNQ
jgi:transposase